MDVEIEKIIAKIETLDEVQKDIKSKQQKLTTQLCEEVAKKLNMHPHEVSFGSLVWRWDCPESPVNFCVYNQDTDPINDCCVVCGKPEERK